MIKNVLLSSKLWVRIILALGTNHLNFGYGNVRGYETSGNHNIPGKARQLRHSFVHTQVQISQRFPEGQLHNLSSLFVFFCLRTEMAAEEIITDKTIGHMYQNYATSRSWIDLRAHEIRRELKQVRWVTSQSYI